MHKSSDKKIKHLGSIIQENEEINDLEDTHCIGVGGCNGVTYAILCYKKVPPKFKGKFYQVVVRRTMLYGHSVCQSRTLTFKDESCQNEDASMDRVGILVVVELEMRIFKTG